QPDRTRADDDDEIARADGGIDTHRVIGDRVRLGETRDLERERVRDLVQTARRHAHASRHCAVDAIAKSFSPRAQVVPAGPAEQTVAADPRSGLAYHPVSLSKSANRATHLRNGAAELVTEHDRDIHRPRVRIPRLVYVGTTHRYGTNLDEDLIFVNVRDGDFA